MSAALVYGAGDFFGGLASRRTPTIAVVLWSQLAGLLILGAVLPFAGGRPHAADLEWGALAGVIGAAAVGLLYRGLAIGAMGVVSPITAALAAVLPVLYGAARHIAPSSLATAGIGVSIVAVIAISAAPPESRERGRKGIIEAVGAGALFGGFFITLAQTHAGAGLYPLVGARIASFIVFAAVGRLLHVSFRLTRQAAIIIVAGGTCDMLANILYLLAVRSGPIGIVAVLTSLYPASTVALAAVVLHERLRPLQLGGVALAVAGIALISAGR